MSNLADSRTLQTSPAGVVEAPLLEATLGRLESDQRHVVYDLGPASSGTLACFANGRSRLTFADAVEELTALAAETDPSALKKRIDDLLPRADGAPVTLVLCWDLPNFLSRPALRALMECLTERCGGGALFHQFIAYPARESPLQPGRYGLRSDGKVIRLRPPTESRGTLPVLPMRELEQVMPNCHLVRSVLLASGMQDCLFRYGG